MAGIVIIINRMSVFWFGIVTSLTIAGVLGIACRDGSCQ